MELRGSTLHFSPRERTGEIVDREMKLPRPIATEKEREKLLELAVETSGVPVGFDHVMEYNIPVGEQNGFEFASLSARSTRGEIEFPIAPGFDAPVPGVPIQAIAPEDKIEFRATDEDFRLLTNLTQGQSVSIAAKVVSLPEGLPAEASIVSEEQLMVFLREMNQAEDFVSLTSPSVIARSSETASVSMRKPDSNVEWSGVESHLVPTLAGSEITLAGRIEIRELDTHSGEDTGFISVSSLDAVLLSGQSVMVPLEPARDGDPASMAIITVKGRIDFAQ